LSPRRSLPHPCKSPALSPRRLRTHLLSSAAPTATPGNSGPREPSPRDPTSVRRSLTARRSDACSCLSCTAVCMCWSSPSVSEERSSAASLSQMVSLMSQSVSFMRTFRLRLSRPLLRFYIALLDHVAVILVCSFSGAPFAYVRGKWSP